MRPDIFLADAMSKNIIFWLGVFAVSMLVMAKPAQAVLDTTPPIMQYQVLHPTNNQTCEGVTTATVTYSTPDLARLGFQASFPRYCTISGVVNYVQTASSFVLTSNTSLTYNIGAIAANQYTGGSDAVIGVVKTWSEVTTCPAPTVLTTIPYAYNSTTQLCERQLPDCPHTYLGIETESGFNVSTAIKTYPYNACDSHGCGVVVSKIASVFGVDLLHQSTTPYLCENQSPPSTASSLDVVLSRAATPLENFDAVVAAAAAVDAARTEQARQDAYIAKVVADGLKAKIAADTAAAEAAVAAQKQAVADVKRKAGEVTANPTTTNINNYNNAVTNYNNTVSVVSNAITQLQDDYAVQVANENNAQDSVNDASAIKAKIDALKDAIAASGQPYNPADVAEKTAGDTALADQLAAATASLAEAAAELAKAAAAASQAAADIAAAGKSLADTAAAIKRLLDGLPLCITNPADPSCKPVVPFCVEHPTDPTCQPPPNTPFCVDHPTDPACVPPPSTDCSKTPDAPGCKPVDCTVSPNAPGCMDICKDHPERAGCTDLGTVSDDVPLDEKTVTISAITPVSVGGAGACPAPIPMVLHGQTYYMKFDTYCNFATGIKPIILVFAWLAATGILIGGFKAS